MNRILLGLVLVLAVVCTGRYVTEAEVQARHARLDRLADAQSDARRQIKTERLSAQVLESATRLSDLNSDRLSLDMVSANQLIEGDDLAAVVGMENPRQEPVLGRDVDVIGNAIGMSMAVGKAQP